MTATLRSFTPLAATLAFVVAGCATAPPAPPGPKLSEVLAKSPRRGTQADIAQIVGKKLPPSVTPNGLEAQLVYQADGTFDGTLKNQAGAVSRDKGTWTMDNNGKFCMVENLVDWNRVISKCMAVYVVGKELWVANDGAGPNDPVVKFTTLD